MAGNQLTPSYPYWNEKDRLKVSMLKTEFMRWMPMAATCSSSPVSTSQAIRNRSGVKLSQPWQAGDGSPMFGTVMGSNYLSKTNWQIDFEGRCAAD